jgi:hypothetical protein
MSQIVRLFSRGLFAVIMYLILVEMVGPWFHLPGLGNIGFTVVFVLFSLSHCWVMEGWPARCFVPEIS